MTCTTISYKWFDRNGVLAGGDICRLEEFKERVEFFLQECKHRDYVNLSKGLVKVDLLQEVLDGCVVGEHDASFVLHPMQITEDDVNFIKEALRGEIKAAMLAEVGDRVVDSSEELVLACEREEKKKCGV